MWLNFSFLKDYRFFHISNVIQLNFSEFHQKNSNFPKINGHLRIFYSYAIFNHCARPSQRWVEYGLLPEPSQMGANPDAGPIHDVPQIGPGGQEMCREW
jgi:hypothetical protein